MCFSATDPILFDPTTHFNIFNILHTMFFIKKIVWVTLNSKVDELLKHLNIYPYIFSSIWQHKGQFNFNFFDCVLSSE